MNTCTPPYALQVWPHGLPGNGLWGLWEDEHKTTPHTHFIHSGGYWIAEAIRNSSYYTADIEHADLVYVDMHCYLQVNLLVAVSFGAQCTATVSSSCC